MAYRIFPRRDAPAEPKPKPTLARPPAELDRTSAPTFVALAAQPEYVEATRKVDDLRARLIAVDQEIHEAVLVDRQNQGDALTTKLLDNPKYRPPASDRLDRLRDQAAALRRAIDLAEHARGAVRNQLTARVRAELWAQHRTWCRQTVNGLLACAAANQKQEALRYAADLSGYGGVPWPQFQYPFPDPGKPTDPSSVLRQWLDEALEHDMITRAEHMGIIEGLRNSVPVEEA